MTLDYAAMAKTAVQSQEKNNHIFDEGETLCVLVPFQRDGDDHPSTRGRAWVSVAMHGGKIGKKEDGVGRSAMSYDPNVNPLIDNPHMRAALPFDPPTPCPIAKYIRENLSSKDAKGAQAKDQFAWVIVPLWHRRRPGKGEFENIYTKPKYIIAKEGNRKNPHIQAGIYKLLGDGEGPKLFDPENPALVSFEREGREFNDTTYKLKMADGDNATAVLTDELKADIADATRPGGYCDLFTVLAEKFAPSPSEINEKLYGIPAESPEGMEE